MVENGYLLFQDRRKDKNYIAEQNSIAGNHRAAAVSAGIRRASSVGQTCGSLFRGLYINHTRRVAAAYPPPR
jgi:hypothetical protein